MNQPRISFRYFDGDNVSIINNRIAFREVAIDREEICLIIDLDLESIQNASSSKVIVNPVHTTASELLAILEKDNALPGSGDNFNFKHNYPAEYDINFKWTCSDDCNSARMSLIFVAYKNEAVVGFANVEVCLKIGQGEDHSEPPRVSYFVEPHLVYVLGSERGKGYGLDLSAACSDVVCEIFDAVYDSVPKGVTINTSLLVEYQSVGGQKFTEYMHERLCWKIDDKDEFGHREDIVLTGPELDGGW